MKISKTFRLSEEAVAKLDKQENATQYLEDLILNSSEQLTEARVIELIKQHATPAPLNIPNITTAAEFVPKPPDPEYGYPCCKGLSPCKHWIWDDTEAIWKNTLTGKTREE